MLEPWTEELSCRHKVAARDATQLKVDEPLTTLNLPYAQDDGLLELGNP
jgi:hypothetical protein